MSRAAGRVRRVAGRECVLQLLQTLRLEYRVAGLAAGPSPRFSVDDVTPTLR